jgi:hypothetical protein
MPAVHRNASGMERYAAKDHRIVEPRPERFAHAGAGALRVVEEDEAPFMRDDHAAMPAASEAWRCRMTERAEWPNGAVTRTCLTASRAR